MTGTRVGVQLKFYLVGLLVAALEEFITQGVLKGTYTGWVLPTLIAFLPFLLIIRVADGVFARLGAARAAVAYYLAAGGLGLLIEWFLIGLAPWKSQVSLLSLLLQLGMFSFWASVAMAPRILLDTSASVAGVRKWYRRFLVAGFAFIYFVAFTTPANKLFTMTILSVIGFFGSANAFYWAYFRKLAR